MPGNPSYPDNWTVDDWKRVMDALQPGSAEWVAGIVGWQAFTGGVGQWTARIHLTGRDPEHRASPIMCMCYSIGSDTADKHFVSGKPLYEFDTRLANYVKDWFL